MPVHGGAAAGGLAMSDRDLWIGACAALLGLGLFAWSSRCHAPAAQVSTVQYVSVPGWQFTQEPTEPMNERARRIDWSAGAPAPFDTLGCDWSHPTAR